MIAHVGAHVIGHMSAHLLCRSPTYWLRDYEPRSGLDSCAPAFNNLSAAGKSFFPNWI